MFRESRTLSILSCETSNGFSVLPYLWQLGRFRVPGTKFHCFRFKESDLIEDSSTEMTTTLSWRNWLMSLLVKRRFSL